MMRDRFAGVRKSIPTVWPMSMATARSECQCAFRDIISTRRPGFTTIAFGISVPRWDATFSQTLPANLEESIFTLTCTIRSATLTLTDLRATEGVTPEGQKVKNLRKA